MKLRINGPVFIIIAQGSGELLKTQHETRFQLDAEISIGADLYT